MARKKTKGNANPTHRLGEQDFLFPHYAVDKRTALQLLAQKGPVSIAGFAEALRAMKKSCRTPAKAHRILERLKAQRLAHAFEVEGQVTYKYPRGGTLEITRTAWLAYWEITAKGRARLEYWAVEAEKAKGKERRGKKLV